MLTAVGLMIGVSEDGSMACWWQAILTNICPLWSIFWSTMIIFSVICFLRDPKTRTEPISLYTHIVCWLLPVLLTFLILSTNKFGCYDGEEECWCFIADRENSGKWLTQFWGIVSFYMWIWIALIGYCCGFIYLLSVVPNIDEAKNRIRLVLARQLLGYPLIYVVTWTLNMVYDIHYHSHSSSDTLNSNSFQIALTCMPALQGALTGSLFLAFHITKFGVSQRRVHVSSVHTDGFDENDDKEYHRKLRAVIECVTPQACESNRQSSNPYSKRFFRFESMTPKGSSSTRHNFRTASSIELSNDHIKSPIGPQKPMGFLTPIKQGNEDGDCVEEL